MGSESHLKKSKNSLLFYNNKNFFRGTGNPVSSSNNNNEAPTEDEIPDSNDAPGDNSISPSSLSKSPPPPAPVAPTSPPHASRSQTSPPPPTGAPPSPCTPHSSPSPAPPDKPFPVHLKENDLQIRTDILETASGNCW